MSEPVLEQRSGNDPLSMMILSEVADQEDIDPIDLSPKLSTVIDTDALETLFFDGTDEFTRVEFTYGDHRVTIQGDALIEVEVE